MNKEDIYAHWAPDNGIWSLWAKPVLFAHMDMRFTAPITALPSPLAVPWCPASDAGVALVIDLPGIEGVNLSLALATKGYRPVPLYNALPLPSAELLPDSSPGRMLAAVDIPPIIRAMQEGTQSLAALSLATNAPPVFLLDSRRQSTGVILQPGEFDNRSICFTTDFPSALYLGSHGIKRVLLIQQSGPQPQSDLAHILLRWQQAGLIIQLICLDSSREPTALEIPRPSWFGAMFQRALARLRFSSARSGGFGAWIPDSSAGG